MKILRWLLFVPLALASLALCMYIIPYVLAFIWKILDFVFLTGSRFDVPPFGIECAIEDFKTFIFTTCLGSVISGGIAGYIAGAVAPKSNHPQVTTTIYAIPLVCLLTMLCYSSWNSEHWFYSTCLVITFIITGLVSIGITYGVNES